MNDYKHIVKIQSHYRGFKERKKVEEIKQNKNAQNN